MSTEKPDVRRAIDGLEKAARGVENRSGDENMRVESTAVEPDAVSADVEKVGGVTQNPSEFKGLEIPAEAFDVETYKPGSRNDDVALRYSTRIGDEIRRETYYYKDADSDKLLPASIQDRFPANSNAPLTQIETEEAEMDTQFRERGDDNIPYTKELRTVAQKSLRETLAMKDVDEETFSDLLESINKPGISAREVRFLVWQLKQLPDIDGPARKIPTPTETGDVTTHSQEGNEMEVPRVIEVAGGREYGKGKNGIYLIKDGGKWRVPGIGAYTGRDGDKTVKIRFSGDRKNVFVKTVGDSEEDAKKQEDSTKSTLSARKKWQQEKQRELKKAIKKALTNEREVEKKDEGSMTMKFREGGAEIIAAVPNHNLIVGPSANIESTGYEITIRTKDGKEETISIPPGIDAETINQALKEGSKGPAAWRVLEEVYRQQEKRENLVSIEKKEADRWNTLATGLAGRPEDKKEAEEKKIPIEAALEKGIKDDKELFKKAFPKGFITRGVTFPAPYEIPAPRKGILGRFADWLRGRPSSKLEAVNVSDRINAVTNERQRIATVDAKEAGVSSAYEKFKAALRDLPRALAWATTSVVITGLVVSGTLPTVATIVALTASSFTTVFSRQYLKDKRGGSLLAMFAGVGVGVVAGNLFSLLEDAFQQWQASLPIGESLPATPPSSVSDPTISPADQITMLNGPNAGETITVSPPPDISGLMPPDASAIAGVADDMLKPEYIVQSGDAVARHALDGYLQTQVLTHDLFSGWSDGAQQQFIDAMRRTLVENPDFAHQLSSGAVIRDGDLIAHVGDIFRTDIFQNKEFLDALQHNILTHEKSHLMLQLGNSSAEVDVFLDKLNAIAG